MRAPVEGAAEVEGAPEIAAAAREFELSPGAEQRQRLAEALTHARRALAAPTSILLAVLEAEAAAADADAARAAAAAIEAAAIETAAPAAAETAANPAHGASAPKTAPDPLPALLELTTALQTARAEREATARAELAAAAAEDRRRDWWQTACDRGRALLASSHADRLLGGSVGALLIILAWLVSRITGTTPTSLGGP